MQPPRRIWKDDGATRSAVVHQYDRFDPEINGLVAKPNCNGCRPPPSPAAIADDFALRSAKEYPSSYARKLRFSLGAERTPDGVADGAPEYPALTHDVTGGVGLLEAWEGTATLLV